ncbi:MAG: hypothetical protein JXQ76_08795, partial [Campylobacterales bacterium]|nr:hypothetical protein [Campylobacterales bacterium]
SKDIIVEKLPKQKVVQIKSKEPIAKKSETKPKLQDRFVTLNKTKVLNQKIGQSRYDMQLLDAPEDSVLNYEKNYNASFFTFNKIPKITKKSASKHERKKQQKLAVKQEESRAKERYSHKSDKSDVFIQNDKHIEQRVEIVLNEKIKSVHDTMQQSINNYEMNIDWLATQIFHQLKDELDIEYRRLM